MRAGDRAQSARLAPWECLALRDDPALTGLGSRKPPPEQAIELYRRVPAGRVTSGVLWREPLRKRRGRSG